MTAQSGNKQDRRNQELRQKEPDPVEPVEHLRSNRAEHRMGDLPRLHAENPVEAGKRRIGTKRRDLFQQSLERRERCHERRHHDDRDDQFDVGA